MDSTTFELDLHDVEGGQFELHYEEPGRQARWVVEGADADLDIDDDQSFCVDLTAQLSGDTLQLDGEVSGTFYYKCGRCMEWRETEVDEEVDFVLMSRDSWTDSYEGEEEIALEESDMDVSYYEGQTIDLQPLIREAVLLALPSFPMCPDELQEACDEAYHQAVGEETIEQNEDNATDLRWSKLKDIELEDDDS